jgi:hypothetical protein
VNRGHANRRITLPSSCLSAALVALALLGLCAVVVVAASGLAP